mgnify:CR=1 FL=1
MDERILAVMRNMAWERAKGEMEAMLTTYLHSNGDNFERFNAAKKAFIKKIEDNGYQE